LNSSHSLYRLTSSSKFLERRRAVLLRTSSNGRSAGHLLCAISGVGSYRLKRCGRAAQFGQARPITKHVIAVQIPTNAKMASRDHEFVEEVLDVGSLGFVGSAVGSARILNDRSRREIMIGNAVLSDGMKQQSYMNFGAGASEAVCRR
jgi:hypothetical protein